MFLLLCFIGTRVTVVVDGDNHISIKMGREKTIKDLAVGIRAQVRVFIVVFIFSLFQFACLFVLFCFGFCCCCLFVFVCVCFCLFVQCFVFFKFILYPQVHESSFIHNSMDNCTVMHPIPCPILTIYNDIRMCLQIHYHFVCAIFEGSHILL